jgi:zinc D-Ala-D-Ala carboxypeptidase
MAPGVTRSAVAAFALCAVLVGCDAMKGVATPATSSVAAAEPVGIGPAASEFPGGPSSDGAALSIGPGAIDTSGGSLPGGQMVSPFDPSNPIVQKLDPLLRKAIQDAASAAGAEGVDVMLTSGWRSRGFQQRLFDDAVRTYGSVDEARQFVASPDVSMHVVGRAVDVGPTNADDWMIRNGARFGLCQIYANEIWHFELAVDAQGNCPPLRPNAAG